jgi:hypothetical protein
MGGNPCDPDTDDDQAGDGAEAAAGSDPLDPASQPLPVLGEQPDPLLFAGCLSLPQPQAQQVPIASPNQGYVVASDSSWLLAQRLQDGSLEVKVLCDDIAARGRHSGELLLTAAGRRPMMVSVELLAGGKAAYLPLVLHDV